VNYARRQVGNKVYGGQSSHLPLKLNMAGVIPPIFASSIILLPATVANWFSTGDSMRWLKDISSTLSPGQPVYVLLYATAIVFFCFFYTALALISFGLIGLARAVTRFQEIAPTFSFLFNRTNHPGIGLTGDRVRWLVKCRRLCGIRCASDGDLQAETAVKETKKNGVFVIPGIGRLVKAERKARIGRNPQTGAAIKIKAKTVVKFRVAKAAKDVIAPTKK
jgi:nucleoid DNA-binding protein